MRPWIIAVLATLTLLVSLSTTALADDHLSATTTAFPDDPGIPDDSY